MPIYIDVITLWIINKNSPSLNYHSIRAFLCWSSFYTINESALGRAHVVVPSAKLSLHLSLLSILTTSYSSAAVGPYLHSRPRLSPSSTEAFFSTKSLQRNICHRDLPCLHHHEFCPSSSSAASVTLLHNTNSRVLVSLCITVLVHFAAQFT